MKVLITNNRSDLRGGSGAFARDLAYDLQRLGHSVIGYSHDLRQREPLPGGGPIPVLSDFENLPFRPDIIHAQHHLDTMLALTALPGVPAIYHCHGAVMQETQPKHPRIYRYLAMSKTLAERMAIESNIPPSQIKVCLNAIDLSRFQTVRKPPVKPTRALFYNKWHRADSRTLAAIREAAGQCDLQLDCVGYHFKNLTEFPQKLLPAYDIVFASGISAIEAMACGCAVVVLGQESCGRMVSTENFERLREVNFSLAVNSAPPSIEKIAAELRRYSAEDCAAVSQRLRTEADFAKTARGLVVTYASVIDQHSRTKPDLRGEMRAVLDYLRRLTPLVHQADNFLNQSQDLTKRAASFGELRAALDAIGTEARNRNH